MRDRILEAYELVKQKPRTVEQISKEMSINYSFAWKKTYALAELGKIRLFESKREKGTYVAHLNGKKAREDAEIEAFGNEVVE